MSSAAIVTGPLVDATGVTFRLPDRHARLAGVRLYQEVRIPGDELGFRHRAGVWSLRLARPAADRMEYLFELEHQNSRRETITDPANPARAAGAFGDKSVVEFPGYRAPWWLGAQQVPAGETAFEVASAELGCTLHGTVWQPDGLTGPAPLLVAHDGPEYAQLGGLTRFVGALVAAGTIAPMRVALLAPEDRNRWYAVNPAYARALATEILPAVAALAPSTVRVGAGASLGALAMLHAHRSAPASFDALFLQSGSFFTPVTDAQERRFSRFAPITRFTSEVAQAVADPHPVPVVLTCGVLEENLANNRAMTFALQRLGYDASLTEVRDVHNYTAWRDALDPGLTGLLAASA